MPVSFKFSKKLGFKVYCMDPMCILNPLKHNLLPESLKDLLFEGLALEPEKTEPKAKSTSVPLRVSAS